MGVILLNEYSYKNYKPFKFWCQTVMPLVYDDSLSYYELLCKVVNYINGFISDLSTAEDDINDLKNAYQMLENYVNEYFNNLDVYDAISDKLDSMVTDGTFDVITTALIADRAVTVFKLDSDACVSRFEGDTLEDKVATFIKTAKDGARLDLCGATVNITRTVTKTEYARLCECQISNGTFIISDSIDGWLDISSDTAGYRSPMFLNCTFTGGKIFKNECYNFKCVCCSFINTQIVVGDYAQAIELIGCNIFNRYSYLIDINWGFVIQLTNCCCESGNYGVLIAHGINSRPSVTSVSIVGGLYEGFSHPVFTVNGCTAFDITNTYVEKVDYLIYDEGGYNEFHLTVTGGIFDNRAVANRHLIYTPAPYPFIRVDGITFKGNDSHFFTNTGNYIRQILNVTGTAYIFDGDVERFDSRYVFNNAATISFKTNGTSLPSQPQAFIGIMYRHSSGSMRPLVFMLTARLVSGSWQVIENNIGGYTTELTGFTWACSGGQYGTITFTGTPPAEFGNYSVNVINLGTAINSFIR